MTAARCDVELCGDRVGLQGCAHGAVDLMNNLSGAVVKSSCYVERIEKF
jgi:hypothetical protein